MTREAGTERAKPPPAAGRGVGFIGQFHLYFDDLFPNSLGKPLIGTSI